MKDIRISINMKNIPMDGKKEAVEKVITREQREKMIKEILNKNYRIYDRLAEI